MSNNPDFFLWTSKDQTQLETELIAKISLDEAWKHVVWLTENALPRMSGTPGEQKAVEYIKTTLESYGLPVTISEFDAHVSIPGEGQLRAILPESREIPCQAQGHSVCPPDGIEGELVYIGSNFVDKIKTTDVHGKIVLAEARKGASIPEVARFAEDVGAIGVVLANWAEHFVNYSIKQVMGNPAPHQVSRMPNIPAVSIKVSDVNYLKDQLTKGVVRLWMHTTADSGWKRTVQPMAVLEAEDPTHAMLAGHHDAWGGGVICNATGTGFILELARIFAQYKGRFKRSFKIGTWSGHENGMCSGSVWYLDNMWEDAKKNLITTYTVDSPGHIDQPLHRSVNTPEIQEFHEACIKTVISADQLDSPLSYPDDAKVGDSMFFPWDLGSPAIWDGKRNSSSYSEWHSDADDLSKGRPDILQTGLKVYLVSISRLLNSPILPFNFVRLIDQFHQDLLNLQERGKGTLDLQRLLTEITVLRKQMVELNLEINKVLQDPIKLESVSSVINTCLIKLGRILNPLLYSEAPFHDYDAYGSSGMNWIPSLHPITELAKLDPNSDNFKVVRTGLQRQHNRILDGLQDALELVQVTYMAIRRD